MQSQIAHTAGQSKLARLFLGSSEALSGSVWAFYSCCSYFVDVALHPGKPPAGKLTTAYCWKGLGDKAHANWTEKWQTPAVEHAMKSRRIEERQGKRKQDKRVYMFKSA